MNHLLFHLPWSLLSPSQKLAKSHNENQPVVTTEDVCTKKSPHQEILTASSIHHIPFNFFGLWRPPYTGTTAAISSNLWPLPHFDQDGLLTSPYTFMFIPNSKTLLTLFVHLPVHFPSSSIQINLFLNSSPSTIWCGGGVCHDCRPHCYLPALNSSTATWDLESQANASSEINASFMDTRWVHTLLGA